MKPFVIRKAHVEDAEKIAVLHANSWKNTYRGILSGHFLEAEVEKDRLQHWKKKLPSLTHSEFVLVAEKDNTLLGFVALLDKPEAGFDAFIDNLHTRGDMKGKGVGTALMRAVAQRLQQSGRKSVYLWVLKGNHPAEEFYKRRGGEALDSSTVHFGGKDVEQTRFGWRTLNTLL